jgi:hypothetical protein
MKKRARTIKSIIAGTILGVTLSVGAAFGFDAKLQHDARLDREDRAACTAATYTLVENEAKSLGIVVPQPTVLYTENGMGQIAGGYLTEEQAIAYPPIIPILYRRGYNQVMAHETAHHVLLTYQKQLFGLPVTPVKTLQSIKGEDMEKDSYLVMPSISKSGRISILVQECLAVYFASDTRFNPTAKPHEPFNDWSEQTTTYLTDMDYFTKHPEVPYTAGYEFVKPIAKRPGGIEYLLKNGPTIDDMKHPYAYQRKAIAALKK